MSSIFGAFSLPTVEAEKVNLFPLTKTSLSTSDNDVLKTVTSPNQGDIAVIDTIIDTENVNKTAYMYNGTQWVALNGNVEADKVILTSNITMAGNYTQVGNLTKAQTGTATFATKGLSVADALVQIFSKKLQPTITANPSLGNVTISKTGAVECGTSITSVTVSAVTFNAGSYTYGPATGVVANAWTTTRISNNGSVAVSGAGTGGAVTDAGPFVMGDQTGDYTELSYRVEAQYGNGVVAHDNLGGTSSPEVQIKAGSCNKTSGKITTFRKYFYGASTAVPAAIDSAAVRALTNSTGACSNGKQFNITIPEGTNIVVIAYPATFRDLTSVKDVGAFGTDIIGSFVKTTIKVAGANNYAPIDYKVYTYKPAASLGANTYEVTI